MPHKLTLSHIIWKAQRGTIDKIGIAKDKNNTIILYIRPYITREPRGRYIISKKSIVSRRDFKVDISQLPIVRREHSSYYKRIKRGEEELRRAGVIR